MKQTKWKLALAAFAGPFVIASVSLFAGLTNFDSWSAFVQLQAQGLLALYAAADVAHKALIAKYTGGGQDAGQT